MSEPVNLMRMMDTGDFFKVDPDKESWRGSAVTWFLALPADEMRALLAERDALRAEAERSKAPTPPAPDGGRCRWVGSVWTHDGGCVPWDRKCPTAPDLRALIDEFVVATALFRVAPTGAAEENIAWDRLKVANRALADAARKGGGK